MALAVLAAGGLRAVLPPELRSGDARWAFVVVLFALLAILIGGDPGRIDRDSRWLRALTRTLIGVVSLVNASAAIRLVVGSEHLEVARDAERRHGPSRRPGRAVPVRAGRDHPALAPCRASCRSCSPCLDSEVFSTVPPNLLIASTALSGVTFSTIKNSADVPGWSIPRT
jgi:hypothetical protein